MFRFCIRYNIRLEPEWVPREMNELADYFSRVVDHHDWYVDHTVFAMVDKWWGPNTINRFCVVSLLAWVGRCRHRC